MDKPKIKPIRLKYIPTDMFAVRYFKEKPFIVPEGTSFRHSDNVDFSTLNIELKEGGIYSFLFDSCLGCKIDTNKLKLNQISKDTISIFSYIDNTEIVGELPTLFKYDRYFYYWRLEKMTDEYIFELAEKISNMKFIDGKLIGESMFESFPYVSNFQTYDYGYNRITVENVFPILDFSKWNLNLAGYGNSTFLYNGKIYRLKMFVPKEVGAFNFGSFGSLYVEILENYDFSKFNNTEFESSPGLKFYIFYGDNLGAISNMTTYYFTNALYWGCSTGYTRLENKQGEIIDRTTPEESRRSLIYTLIEHSFDRKTAGYPTATIYLHNNTKSVLTQDEIAQITAKGFTIA